MDKFEKELVKLKEKSRFRQIPDIDKKDGKYIFSNGKKYLNLSSNDYLGLANDKKLVEEFLQKYSNNDDFLFSSASARLLTGNQKSCNELESALAKAYQKDKALLFNSGYHANIGMVSALCQKGCAVFSDKLNHASIIDGMKLADGDFYRYRHLDYEHLESLLEKHQDKYEQLIIISESIFSMDGDACDIERLVEIKKQFDTILIIDEAHAFGLFGENGLGLSESIKDVDLIIATFGKALASYGAFIVGDEVLINYLINTARSFIFSTSIPPVSVLWSKFLFEEKLPEMIQKRAELLFLANELREAFTEKGIETLGNSQIVPVILSEDEKAVRLAKVLKSKGYWALPIRPPTVPVGSARLRISLSANMNWDDVKELPDLIYEGLK